MHNSFQPLVSILVPVYNVENYIHRCLESIINQSYENIEVIIVNDCSKDSSVKIINEILTKSKTNKIIKIINHDENLGLGGARLTGLKNTTGEWLMFVDGDDYLELDAVKKLVEFANDSNPEMIVFGYNIVYSKKTVKVKSDFDYKENYIQGMLLRNKCVAVWNKFYKTSLFIDNNIYPEIGLNQGEDYAITPRVAEKAKKIIRIDEPLYNYIQYNTTSYTKNFKKDHIQQLKRADDILYAFFENLMDDEILKKMRIRTILYMFKISSLKTYKDILSIYISPLHSKVSGLSLQDNLLIYLIKKKLYRVISIINWLRNIYLRWLY